MSLKGILKRKVTDIGMGKVAKKMGKGAERLNKKRIQARRAKIWGKRITNKFKIRPRASRASASKGLTTVGELFGRGKSKTGKKMTYIEQKKVAREMQESKAKKTREKGTIKKAGERLRGLAKKRVDSNANKIYWAIENNTTYDVKQKKLRVQLLDFVHDSCLEGASKKNVKDVFVEKHYPNKLTTLGLKYYDGIIGGV